MPVGPGALDELVYDREPEFLVCHFTAAKPEGQFDLHFFAEEIDGVAEFDLQIMRVDGRAELDFFDFVGVLVFSGFFIPLGQFVAVFAVINQTTDRRSGLRRHFDQVNPLGAGGADRVAEAHHTQLPAVHANDSYFTGANSAVYPDKLLRKRRGTRKRAIQEPLTC